MKVIVSDVDSRKGFDLVNIMNRFYGYECILSAPRDYNFQLPIIYRQNIYPLRSLSYDVFEKDLSKLLELFRGDSLVYLPVSERPTRLLYAFIEKNGKPEYLHFLLPDKEIFELTSDKGSFQQYCELHHYPVPKSFLKNEVFSRDFSFIPLIAKPISGEGSVGIKHIDRPDQLDLLKSLDASKHIIQEKIQGERKVAGAFYLCKDGDILCQYTHQRIRTFPENGGVTVYSKSGNNNEILSIGANLLHSLNWNGLAMIEFIQDSRTKEWKMIELNPRLWGSALLSAFNQSRMLDNFVKSCTEQAKSSVSSSKRAKTTYIRWWFPFEVFSFLKGNLSLRELFTLNTKNTCYINFSYASFTSSLAYLTYFIFNVRSIKRFFKKLI